LGEAHLAQAMFYYHGLRDYVQAREELATARRLLPNNAEIFTATGLIDRRQGRWDDAVKNLEKAAELDPRNPRILGDLAILYDLLRRYDEEQAVFDRAAAANPGNAAAGTVPFHRQFIIGDLNLDQSKGRDKDIGFYGQDSWKAGRLTHSYPHCWRCGTPLLYYARTSWFVRTTAFKDAMLARNARVDWHPSSIGDGRFGEWLTNNIDWAISRDRYWGTPLPVWLCDADSAHVECIGGYAELAERVGRALPHEFDPHKPHVDHYMWRCRAAGCAGTMRRAPEVIDTWFDSGAMSFAQWHYPFENRDQLAEQYPADFIAEGVDQTRGWFYSLLAIATGLGDALPNNQGVGEHSDGDRAAERRGPHSGPAPFGAVVVNDLVLDAHGQKMSKSKGNVVEPWGVIERHGVDAVRLFLMASSNVWVPRSFDERVLAEQSGRFLRTFKNVYSGIFAQYANFGWSPSDQDPAVSDRPAIDRWMISRLGTLARTVDAALDAYDATTAARAIISGVMRPSWTSTVKVLSGPGR
jgi:valyl-tRNA synthetase